MQFNWLALQFDNRDGYGRLALTTLRELLNKGVNVRPFPISVAQMPVSFQQQIDLSGTLTIQCAPADKFQQMPGTRVWGYTMCEGTRCPDGWAEQINAVCERLIVPCEQNAQAFRDSGVCIPIHVVHGGADEQEFYPVSPTAKRQPFTFLALADRGRRKGWITALDAFGRAFPDNQNVRLILKTRKGGLSYAHLTFTDARISLWEEDLPSMREAFAQADCFVFPSYAEGWGMPPREAALTEIPVIATAWSGLEVGIEHWAIPLRKFTFAPADAPLGYQMTGAEWVVPDVEELAEKMQYVVSCYPEAKQAASSAAHWIRNNQTWAHSACEITRLVEEYGDDTH